MRPEDSERQQKSVKPEDTGIPCLKNKRSSRCEGCRVLGDDHCQDLKEVYTSYYKSLRKKWRIDDASIIEILGNSWENIIKSYRTAVIRGTFKQWAWGVLNNCRKNWYREQGQFSAGLKIEFDEIPIGIEDVVDEFSEYLNLEKTEYTTKKFIPPKQGSQLKEDIHNLDLAGWREETIHSATCTLSVIKRPLVLKIKRKLLGLSDNADFQKKVEELYTYSRKPLADKPLDELDALYSAYNIFKQESAMKFDEDINKEIVRAISERLNEIDLLNEKDSDRARKCINQMRLLSLPENEAKTDKQIAMENDIPYETFRQDKLRNRRFLYKLLNIKSLREFSKKVASK